MEINKGIETFDDRMDATRNNQNRQTWGKNQSTEQLNLDSEYKVRIEEVPPVAEPPKPPAPPAQEFTHKLANGTELKAASIEELAKKIEAALTQAPPAPVEFEDRPLYTPTEFKRKDLSLPEQADILNLWKENPQQAIRKLEEAEYGVPMETLLQKLTQAELREEQRQRLDAEAEFLMEAETYNATPANAKKIMALLKEKQKPVTKKNLMLAFQHLVTAGDTSLVRKTEEVPEPVDNSVTEVPPPPTHVPANQGRPETPPQAQVDVAKFTKMTLAEQKEFFAKQKRGM